TTTQAPVQPSAQPSTQPSATPAPSTQPSIQPSATPAPSTQPSTQPSATPAPSTQPSTQPSATPAPSTHPDPVPSTDPETGITQYEGYELKWNDEFDSETLNRDDWNVELHDPGWVNAEWQAYVDSEENIYQKDGKLVIKPVKTVDEDGNASYTSGRVNTQGKHDFTYGLFEASVKVPAGKGYLPAFWMMPTDENLYGQWPRCGEIDIMEVMGQDTKTAHGTIHFGNPHAQRQGTTKLTDGDFASEYHTFAVDWEPGLIVWYIDGQKVYETNDWFSTTEGQGTVSYPAPFDQPFYMILNLAIGGSWVGYPDETTTYEDQEYAVDYVRVYQKPQEYYQTLLDTVEAPEKPVVEEPGEGNEYLTNSDFSLPDDLSGKDGSVWEFMMQSDGEATASIVKNDAFGEGASAVKIETTKAGALDYSVQFVQANLPVKKGGKYQIRFDAYAEAERTMIVDVSAPDYNYARYLDDKKVTLTTQKQTFTYEFDVTNHDDANARLEFNLGNVDPASTVYISNVSFTRIGDCEIDDSKKVLTDGNYVYNGKFQEGTQAGKKNLDYWDIVDEGNKATYGVTPITDGRRFKITTTGCEASSDVALKQTELPFTVGEYMLSFDACLDTEDAEAMEMMTVHVGGSTEDFALTNTNTTYQYAFAIAEGTPIADVDDIIFDLGLNTTVLLDNVRVTEDTLIKNGSFNAGLAGFEPYVDSSADATYVVDSLNEDNAFDITINDVADAEWKIQLKQSNVKLEKDQWYRLSFRIKSSVDRKIQYAIQRDGNAHNNDWTPYVQDIVSVSEKYKTVSTCFQMTEPTDEGSIFNIAMGKLGDAITEQHRICIDDIVLVKIDAPVAMGENLIKEADFANGVGEKSVWAETIANWGGECVAAASSEAKDGAITYTIGNTGTDTWHVQFKQNDVPLVKDKTYMISFDVESSMDRKILYAVQKNGDLNSDDWTPYYEEAVEVGPTSKHVEQTFTMKESDMFAVVGFSMGTKEADQITTEHTVTISNIQLVEKESDDPNMLKNADFSEADTNWESAVTAPGAAEVSFADNKAVYAISNVGDYDWNVQLKQSGLTLEKGCSYKLTFKVTSSEARTIKAAFLTTGYDWYGGADIALDKDTEKLVEIPFTVDKDTNNAMTMVISMGIIDGLDTPASTITLSDFSLVKTASAE
ncbi:MAG: carbohydrate binding domain-containing protein, partial [Wujia sp.]